MAKVYWMPEEDKTHSCVAEIHEFEKEWFTKESRHFPVKTVLECSCGNLWRLTDDWTGMPERVDMRFNSFFQSNRTYRWIIWKKT